MLSTHLGASADLPPWAVIAAFVFTLANIAGLVVEMRRGARRAMVVASTGLLAVMALLAAVLRPAHVSARESVVGARVVVLADTSHSMDLADESGRPRREVRNQVIAKLQQSAPTARLVVLGFGDGLPVPFSTAGANAAANGGQRSEGTPRSKRSDLGVALRALAASPEERPAAVVVVSDGRLDDPAEEPSPASLRALGDALHVPVHAIATTREAPADASVRRVSAAGAAVAHVPLPLRVEVGCAGGLSCDELTVVARELRDDGPPAVLASGVAHLRDGKAALDLTVTLERAGRRLVELSIVAPAGDTIPENDRRLVPFDVSRERVRVLHVAGRPTNDVRALRQWLKSDASLDVVAFFILRTPTDSVNASQSELALIPFPVDELFQQHLPSFDAIVLQDFDAQPYGLEKYLENIQRYVRSGGGLVMVGGQNSFVAGGYAGTPLASVLPIELEGAPGATSADPSPFVPEWTAAGLAAPLLGPLRDAIGEDLPQLPGVNVLGNVRPGGIALWSHPTRTTRDGTKMPVLAIGEEGDGRTIALGVDGAWELEFSELGARTGGRGHRALWDGLLGWLMRDPRFEAAQADLPDGCAAGVPATLRARITRLPGSKPQAIGLDVTRIDRPGMMPALHLVPAREAEGTSVDLALPPLAAGGYTARLRFGDGTTARYDFACEAGGDEWADSRPDPQRLEALASATGGSFSYAADAAGLSLPKPTVVSAERHVTPVAPPWLWTLGAAVFLGAHWVARRRSGLS
ncbi:MAG: hypothetical protein M3O50_17620 [Myxococcota bacterium]|nr:hypothetical protein [Myxococcota bacterium]